MFFTYALIYSLSLFFGLILCLKIGHMIGRRHRAAAKESGGSALDGVVFAVLGLLLGFSFSASIDTFNAHRSFIHKEANDIALAYVKIDLLPREDQAGLREMMLQYADARLAATEARVSSQEERVALRAGRTLEDQIWTRVSVAVKKPEMAAALGTVVETFSRMTDATADQLAEKENHLPGVIYALIFLLCLMAALIAGFGIGTIADVPLIRTAVFALSVMAIVYVIVDLEYPRSGIFRATDVNIPLREAIEDMRSLEAIRRGSS